MAEREPWFSGRGAPDDAIHGCARFKAEGNDDFGPLQEPNLVAIAIAVL
ncbi:hypothetical protein ABIF65_007676 [Bradyrhizobium japonicum]|nr:MULTISPECIES: hypothetical protein [Bradyrhizobium]MBR0877504.1 hypothetical protein [Bradyrhizobium liaoningense]MBR0947839.1 hypothetical protein [Bradyrhizobium liaoningense]MBR0996852.1 hypothetical protein [Bradyrhizobium liaoningense]MBR1033525.1 hypothetical protein [Bradyrhizobium liaoningense]MBR1063432.1 hypothetical protein [Bradyrhizobium liaoningense]